MATTFTYTPLVGANQIVPLSLNNGVPTAIPKEAGQGDGRHGKMLIAFVLDNTDGATVGDTVVDLVVYSPIHFDIADKADHAAYWPICSVTPRTPAGNAFPAAAINCTITPLEAVVEDQVPIRLTFTAPGAGLDVAYNVSIDFSHTLAS
jgi:hypothetical protein